MALPSDAALLVGLVAAMSDRSQQLKLNSPCFVGARSRLSMIGGRVRCKPFRFCRRIRKSIWKGKPYPETVLLRLMTANGRPNVKLGASKSGAGLVIGDSDPTYIRYSRRDGKPH